MLERLYTAEEAAQYLRCKRATVIRRIKEGVLRGSRNGTGRTPYLVTESALREYLNAQLAGSDREAALGVLPEVRPDSTQQPGDREGCEAAMP